MGTSVDDPRDIHDASSLRCPRCGRRLNPLSGRDVLRFLCDAGHEIDGDELLADGRLSALAEMEAMLHAWERRVEQLEGTVESARRHGHADVAALYERRLDAARARVRVLRDALGRFRA